MTASSGEAAQNVGRFCVIRHLPALPQTGEIIAPREPLRPSTARPELAHFDGLRHSPRDSTSAGPGQQSLALGRPFRAPGATRDVTLQQLFDAMRAAGLQPHSRSPEQDGRVATELLSVLATLTPDGDQAQPESHFTEGLRPHSTGSSNGSPRDDFFENETPAWLQEPEADLSPSPWFGVAEPACPVVESKVLRYGSYTQIISDLRAMGAGAIRRCKERDVYWGSVFPLEGSEGKYYIGKLVPPPADILAELRDDDYAVLGHFAELLIGCRLAGIEFAITPFDSGGGSAMNPRSSGDADSNDDNFPLEDVYSDELGGRREDFPNGWKTLYANRPEWQHGVRVPSTQGWDRFYWNHGSPASYGQQLFQRFAIQVWPTQEADMLDTSLGAVDSDAYSRECARRKSLAIAAFSQGIAEFLAGVDQVWRVLFDDRTQDGSGGIYRVVRMVELGNELNGLFKSRGDPDALEFVAGEHEAGRYMVLVASPFRWLLPEMQFRASELSSWATEEKRGDCYPEEHCCVTDDFAERLAWLHGAIGTGMVWAWGVELLNQYLAALWISGGIGTELPDSTKAWVISCLSSDYWWPPLEEETSETLSFVVTQLVHEVGFHWFHGNNRSISDETGGILEWYQGYQDAIRMQQDVEALQSVVVDPLAEAGFQLSTTAGAVLFDAVQPVTGLTDPIEAAFYEGANTLLHAGMLARSMCFFHTAGFSSMSWFCPLLGVIESDEEGVPLAWRGESSGTGLPNDISRPGKSREFAATAAWRRPAWFTYRRIAWLLSKTEDPSTLVYNHEGLTVIRHELSAPMGASGGNPTTAHRGRRFRYLWVMWVDQYSDSECLHDAYLVDSEPEPASSVGPRETGVFLFDALGKGYELLSLVPWVTESDDPGETDANGYRQVTARDWTWAGWDGAVLHHGEISTATTSHPYWSTWSGVV